ncbi:alpha-catulin-like isoform X2 [Artemia franciscana]|uniref:Alpha-catulin n=1 Tax=Artemia franciscana TaxID=6661 RepID=A0AA88KVG7_ARTSF|nr:hypothetical protein QYM36_014261 [Artemia franciscana]
MADPELDEPPLPAVIESVIETSSLLEQRKTIPEVTTKSVEKTLLPLVNQIASLVSIPDRPIQTEKGRRAVSRVGRGVRIAVDRFVSVGEAIGDDNPDVRHDMFDACREARAAGAAIEKLCSDMSSSRNSMSGPNERSALVRSARCLLSAVTQVLLLADAIVVKQLLSVKDKVSSSLSRLAGVTNFTEFVKAFGLFGSEMVDLAHATGDRQNDMKDERRRSQMAAARTTLERSTLMLLTGSKTCLRHPDCNSARENRDAVFCQMRRAIDLIHYVVQEGVLGVVDGMNSKTNLHQIAKEEDWDATATASGALQQLDDIVEMTRLTLVGTPCQDRLNEAVEAVSERTQDFTDSAYTSHEHRESILCLCDRLRSAVEQLLRAGINMERQQNEPTSPSEELELSIRNVLDTSRDLRLELQKTSLDQVSDLLKLFKDSSDLIASVKNAAMAVDSDRLEEASMWFQEHVDHVQEVCKILRHVVTNDGLQVASKSAEESCRILGPQILVAAQTSLRYPNSKVAKENFEVFSDGWQTLLSEVEEIIKESADFIRGRAPEKQVYMSLPRPGKHGTTTKPLRASKLDEQEQAKIAKSSLEMKLTTSELQAETDRWSEQVQQTAQSADNPSNPDGDDAPAIDENNDIVKRARNMSSMALSMYQFTRGEGTLKTTQDLFTQAEYFAEEANRLYKVVRQFSYQVPGGPLKKELLDNVDKIPTYVQQVQFTVKNPTVGKAATFTKVDHVISETKSLMDVVSRVVTICFDCAAKYNLDFRGLSPNGRSPARGEDESAAASLDGAKSSGGGGDPNI